MFPEAKSLLVRNHCIRVWFMNPEMSKFEKDPFITFSVMELKHSGMIYLLYSKICVSCLIKINI